MPRNNRTRYQEEKIRRLQRQIAEIQEFLYDVSAADPDRSIHAGMMERKRDDVVRSAVLQIHTAIEDLLDILIVSKVLAAVPQNRKRKLRTARGRALAQLITGATGIGFDKKVTLAVALRLVQQAMARKLREVNRLRNKVSHNWLLSTLIRRGIKPTQRKRPLLEYQGRDVYKVRELRRFVNDATSLYLHLYMKMP
jgi:hypothetical protein